MDSPLPCSGRTDVWFSPDTAVLALAERICREECPVLQACGERAEKIRPAAGVWGGKRYHKGRSTGRVRSGKKRGYGWTPEMDADVVALRDRGMTWGQISMALDRDENSCRGRYRLLTSPASA